MKIVIFCQSMKYISSTLDIYNYYRSKGCEIHIVIREVKIAFDFFTKEFEIPNENLTFLQTYDQKSILSILKARRSIVNCRREIKIDSFDESILFTNEFDYSSFGVLRGYKGKIRILDYTFPKNKNLPHIKGMGKFLVEWFFYGVITNPFINERRYLLRKHYPIETNIPKVMTKKMIYPFDCKSVLFIDSNDQSNGILSNVEKTLKDIIEIFEYRSIKIYVKGHPRLGLSPIFSQYSHITILDDSLPIEFLDLSKASLILGFYSTCLTTVEHSRVYSLLKLNLDIDITHQYEYLISNGFSDSQFIEKYDNLKNTIDSL
ncbi:polysialyltransferase family glycosyltransferase [Vibrio cyclitrophicus]|uniref:polysialyltransferase family glycosyltransferase n=1 Tax=Vibrio cyclitrophicus TaxID=47951 RepID=UPI000314ACBF|nr:polysialyltransferase family glycosyltransferase [Vibrio cyclitrophicus]OCH47766.1 hypothetical protein A6D96_17795 [Vibrio cyclitrophicus]